MRKINELINKYLYHYFIQSRISFPFGILKFTTILF